MIVTDIAGAVLRDPLVRGTRGWVVDLTRDCGRIYVRGRDRRTCFRQALEVLGDHRVEILEKTGKQGRRAFNKRYVEPCWCWDFVVCYGFLLAWQGCHIEQTVASD